MKIGQIQCYKLLPYIETKIKKGKTVITDSQKLHKLNNYTNLNPSPKITNKREKKMRKKQGDEDKRTEKHLLNLYKIIS